MKYLKEYKIFENSKEKIDEIIDDCNDILIDLIDIGFEVSFRVPVYSTKEEELQLLIRKVELFKYEDIKYYIDRIDSYLSVNNFQETEEIWKKYPNILINSRIYTNPVTFSRRLEWYFSKKWTKSVDI